MSKESSPEPTELAQSCYEQVWREAQTRLAAAQETVVALRAEVATLRAQLAPAQPIPAQTPTEAGREALARFPAENPHPVLRVDVEGVITYANPASAPLLDVWQCAVGEVLPPPWDDAVADALEINQRKMVDITCGNRMLSLTFTPIVEGGYVNIYGMDVTARKEAEEALRANSQRLEDMVAQRTQNLEEAHEQLVRQERLAVLGRLAGGVGHELRNPLGVISNAVYYLQLTLGELEDAGERTFEYLDILSQQVRVAERVINELLAFGNVQAPSPESVQLAPLMARLLQYCPPPEHVRVVPQLPPRLPAIWADPQHLLQILCNLFNNGYQAMADGGLLTLRATPARDVVVLAVSDTGEGIPPQHRADIFEPLFSSRTHGIGLGLALCKQLVEVNGGTIWMESARGLGTTFYVRLPAR